MNGCYTNEDARLRLRLTVLLRFSLLCFFLRLERCVRRGGSFGFDWLQFEIDRFYFLE